MLAEVVPGLDQIADAQSHLERLHRVTHIVSVEPNASLLPQLLNLIEDFVLESSDQVGSKESYGGVISVTYLSETKSFRLKSIPLLFRLLKSFRMAYGGITTPFPRMHFVFDSCLIPYGRSLITESSSRTTRNKPRN